MKKFTLDTVYFTSVNIVKTYSRYANKTELTQEELIDAIRGGGISTMTSSEDHPNFASLREQLGAEGYICIERGWWNGDRVTKSFVLNNKIFEKGEQFSCGSAMEYGIKHKKDYNE